jgi:Uma2 family endonuclease
MSIAKHASKPLHPGLRLTRSEFLRRWEALPEIKFAELIDGVVYMPSPQTTDHGRVQNDVGSWLGVYRANTPGCDSGSQSTWLMLQSAPQPDLYLWILPEHGGQSGIQGKYHTGAPELAAEICLTSAAYDLGVKKALYQKARVREYVAFLVEEQEIRWHRLVRGAFELCPPTSRGIYRSTVFPGLWLDRRALWKHDLARVLRTLQRGLDSSAHRAFVQALGARQV